MKAVRDGEFIPRFSRMIHGLLEFLAFYADQVFISTTTAEKQFVRSPILH